MSRPCNEFWPAGVPATLEPPAGSLFANLEASAKRSPDKAALHFMGRTYSYWSVLTQAERLAARLFELGVEPGDRVLVNMQNCPQLIIAHFAVLRANAVVVPVNPMSRADELAHYISDSGARLAIVSLDVAAQVTAADQRVEPARKLRSLIVTRYADAFDPDSEDVSSVPEAWLSWLLADGDPPHLESGDVVTWNAAIENGLPLPEVRAEANDLAVLPYTSGTTGKPKGCMHPHRTVNFNAIGMSIWCRVTSEAVSLVAAPMFHVTGMISVMHASVVAGASMVLMPRWDRQVAASLIPRWRITHWINVPTMVVDLLSNSDLSSVDLSSLRFIGGGGAAMPQAVAQHLLEQFGLRYCEGYGLTEAAAATHFNPLNRPKQQCMGIPYIGCDARVIDPQTLEELPVGEQGEIVLHGPFVFQGYWGLPSATRAVLLEIEGRNFLRTGDLGYADEEGYFFLTDRLKRMINASGFKVWPAEVETFMFQHPAIQEACVVGCRDDYRGESVKAFVVVRSSHVGKVTDSELISWCRENMAVYKAPMSIEFLDALPKTASGKVLWRVLQDRQTPSLSP
jgi:fatty-acyl-CoA synthase